MAKDRAIVEDIDRSLYDFRYEEKEGEFYKIGIDRGYRSRDFREEKGSQVDAGFSFKILRNLP